jgi:hypothetical protein
MSLDPPNPTHSEATTATCRISRLHQYTHNLAMVLNPFKSHEDHGEPAKSSSQEQSLTTVLSTPAQRADLTLLLASCTSAMRKTITDIFDPRYSGAPSDARYDNPLHNPDLDLSKVDVEELDKERNEAEERIKELSEEEMQGLKKSALDFFDAWRDGVLGRVGEVVNSKTEAVKQGEAKEGEKIEQKAPDTSTKKLEPQDVKVKAKSEKTVGSSIRSRLSLLELRHMLSFLLPSTQDRYQ